ncbi:MAG: ABC transporter permease [Gammaproteobacteria bacterium]|nr:ABC transporter permease [Gammaproteobacteria bacterium]
MQFDLMWQSAPQILAGLPETLKLVGLSLLIGFVLAVLVALARLSSLRWLSGLAYGFVYVFRSTPLLVQIYLIYYGSGQFRAELAEWGLWTLFREPYFCAILALALNTGAYTSEVIRGGIQSVSLGEIEAGRALGMSHLKLFSRIVFPIAIRQALPAYGNEIILMVKASSLASTITILEITGIAKKIIAASFAPVEIFIIAGSIYLLINFVVTRAIAFTERRLSPQRFRASTASPGRDGGRMA